MRTVRSSGRLSRGGGGLLGGECLLWGVSAPGGVCSQRGLLWGVSAPCLGWGGNLLSAPGGCLLWGGVCSGGCLLLGGFWCLLPGGSALGGCLLLGGLLRGGCLLWGVSAPRGGVSASSNPHSSIGGVKLLSQHALQADTPAP